MSEQGSDSESDITQLVEKHLLRKPCPASVSCEARTPRGGYHGNPSTDNLSDAPKQNGAKPRTNKKGIAMLGKGKMEIFQIMSDLDTTSQIDSRKKQGRQKNENVDTVLVEESIQESKCNTVNAVQKVSKPESNYLYVPKLENISEDYQKEHNTEDKVSRANVNSDIYERLQALESSISALTPRYTNDYTFHKPSDSNQSGRGLFTPRDNGTSTADVSFQSEELEKWVNLVSTEAQKSTARGQPQNSSTVSCLNKTAKEYSNFLNDSGFTQPPSSVLNTPLHNSTALIDVGCVPVDSTGQLQGNTAFRNGLPIQAAGQLQTSAALPNYPKSLRNGSVPSTGSTFSNAQPPNQYYAPFQINAHHVAKTNASLQTNAQVYYVPFLNSTQTRSHDHSTIQDRSGIQINSGHQNNLRLTPTATVQQSTEIPTDTQTLLYQVQQDMISRQREQNKLLTKTQSEASKMLNSALQSVNHTACLEHPITCITVSQSTSPVQTINNHSVVGNSPIPLVQSSGVLCNHQSSPSNRSEIKDFNQSGSSFNHSQEHQQCQNCNSQTWQQNGEKHRHIHNQLDFTQPEPTANLTLLVDSTRLFLHKEVLSAWSNRWRHLVHVNSSAGDQIILRDTKLQTVLHLLQYIYGIHKDVTDGNVYALLELADKFEMPKIKSECEGYLLAKEASLKLLVIAQNFRLQQLYKKCLEKITRQDLHSLERNPLFSHLNATTTASIYKAEILRLRGVARVSEQTDMRSQQEIRKLKNGKERTRKRFEEVSEQWAVNRNRCFKHGVHITSDFHFSCAECNKKVHRQVQKLCRESETIRGSGLADVSLISDDVTPEGF